METKQEFIDKNLPMAMKVILDSESSLPDVEVIKLAKELIELLDQTRNPCNHQTGSTGNDGRI